MNQNFEQIIIEYYTTTNNQRRSELFQILMTDITNEQQIILEYLQNVFIPHLQKKRITSSKGS